MKATRIIAVQARGASLNSSSGISPGPRWIRRRSDDRSALMTSRTYSDRDRGLLCLDWSLGLCGWSNRSRMTAHGFDELVLPTRSRRCSAGP